MMLGCWRFSHSTSSLYPRRKGETHAETFTRVPRSPCLANSPSLRRTCLALKSPATQVRCRPLDPGKASTPCLSVLIALVGSWMSCLTSCGHSSALPSGAGTRSRLHHYMCYCPLVVSAKGSTSVHSSTRSVTTSVTRQMLECAADWLAGPGLLLDSTLRYVLT